MRLKPGISHASVLQANLEGRIDAVSTVPHATVNVAPHLYFEARRQGHSDAALRSLLAQADTGVHAIDSLLRGLPSTPALTLLRPGSLSTLSTTWRIASVAVTRMISAARRSPAQRPI